MQLIRYMERLGISYQDAIREPNEIIEHALLVWSLDAVRDKLEAKRQA